MKDFNIIIDKDDILKADNETVWEMLVNQIIKGNVIPVLGNEMVKIGGLPSDQFLLDVVVKQVFGINENIPSFTALMNHSTCTSPTAVYKLVSKLIAKNPELFQPTELLKDFLSIEYFPFVITTTIDPTIENTMRSIYGDKLRVLTFDNDPQTNDDICNSYDTLQPTLYYMFGKANDKCGSFVLSDTDLLRFSRSWLLPKDSSSLSKPAYLSNALSNKYLLVLGNNFQGWLFRFFWFAMKDEKLIGKTDIPNGMDASEHSDEKLIEFLNFSNITSQISDLPDFVAELKRYLGNIKSIDKKNARVRMLPVAGSDVFISYSRADEDIAEKLYEMLKARGVKVWYDRENLGLADEFKTEIRRAIRTCKLFVPVLSHSITSQAHDEHIYRLEWLWAIEHKKMISSAIAYISPLAEEGFDMYDRLADIPEDIQCHNAYFYDRGANDYGLGDFVDRLCELLKSK